MDKKYLMKSMVALALIVSVSSCSSDLERAMTPEEIKFATIENAEAQLGITIPEGQTWDMASKVSTDITINLGLDQSYTVGIYDVNPRINKNAKFYALEKVNEGGALNTSITLPNAANSVFIAVYDSNLVLKSVNEASVVGGMVVANVDGTTANRAMRAVFEDKWTNDHSCDWESKLNFELPAGATEMTAPGWLSTGVYVVPTNGSVSLNWVGFNEGDKIYILGNVTELKDVNYNGKVTFYNVGTLTYSVSSGKRHTIINTGELTVTNYANIGDLYNGGALVLDGSVTTVYEWNAEKGANDVYDVKKADIPNDMHIYSNGAGTIEAPCDVVDLKAVCDIHGTLLNEVGNIKIQNSTKKYICAIIAKGKVENVDGPLQTSYVKADLFTFDGNPIYLLPNGHVDVTTLQVPNSNCHVYGHTNSVALVEATNFEFGNKNDFTHTFSNNIYFKVNGGYIKCDNCYAMGHNHYFETLAEYLASDAHAGDNKSDEYALAANRINNTEGTRKDLSPECGDSYTIYVPDEEEDDPDEEEDDSDEEEDDSESGIIGNPQVYTYAFEDQLLYSDYDMNDVVLKISHHYDTENGVYDASKLDVKLVAAGATYSIWVKIGNGDDYLFDGKEVHVAFGDDIGAQDMVNTGGLATAKPVSCTIAAPSGWDGDFNNLDVKIEVLTTAGEAYVVEFLTEETKTTPYAVMIPNDWKWPTERTCVKDAYSGTDDASQVTIDDNTYSENSFAAWAGSEKRTDTMKEWYNYPTEGKVVENE